MLRAVCWSEDYAERINSEGDRLNPQNECCFPCGYNAHA